MARQLECPHYHSDAEMGAGDNGVGVRRCDTQPVH
jgi:hypothetical protein